MSIIIPTSELAADMIPDGRIDWTKIARFASTFDPKLECPSGSIIECFDDVRSDSTISDLRMALYVEWRRWNHFSGLPDQEVLEKAISILGWIRKKISRPTDKELGCMTVNERLLECGVLNKWADAVRRRSREEMLEVLLSVAIDYEEAANTTDAVLENPKKYGY